MEHENNSRKSVEIITTKPVKLVRSADGTEAFEGYAAVWYQPDDEGSQYVLQRSPKVVERIHPNAFDDALDSEDDIEAWLDHSENFILGSRSNQSLTLRADDTGLKYRIEFDPEFVDHLKAKSWVEKKIIRGSSFQALARHKLTKEGSTYVRTIEHIDQLIEVSMVRKPAYKSTAATLRHEIERWERTNELIKRAAKY